MRVLSELKRRNVLRMAALYGVAAWLIMQVAGVLIDLAKLPDWIGTTTLWLLALGFPIVLIFSWFYEITPEGISLEEDVVRGESITHLTGRRLEFVVIALLTAAVIMFAYDKWWTSDAFENSIAVLPFENMSADAEQEYFSDGISEEILNLLAQIPELRVISRTSAFAFRGQSLGISEIGRRLNVSHVLEGSVRRSGNRVRITAQLIQADNEFHLWSNSFDRNLDDVFVVQDEIASAIRDALKLRLALNDVPGDRASPDDEITVTPTTSSEAHIAYLQGRYHLNKRSADGLKSAREQFERAIELDPEYALAYSGLADSYMLLAGYGVIPRNEARQRQRAAAARALELDDNLAEVHASIGTLHVTHGWDWGAALQSFRRAIAINPNYGQALQWYASALAMVDDPQHLTVIRQAHAVDPVSLRVNVDYGLAYYYEREFEKALQQFRNTLELDPEFLATYGAMGLVLLELGRYGEAISAIEKGAAGNLSLWLGYAHAKAGNTAEAIAIREQWGERWRTSKAGAVPIALIHVGLGEYDSAFEWLNRAIDVEGTGITTLQTFVYWDPIRDDPRFAALLRRLNFLD